MFLAIQGAIVHNLNISFNNHNASFLFLQHQGIGHLFTIKISQFSTSFSIYTNNSESWLSELNGY